MSNQEVIGTYILDTLQIFFAWDDDLYTYLKKRGLGEKGIAKKVFPLIYSDNCESTTGDKERPRKCVINVLHFGKTYGELGWRDTGKSSQPIIPAEKPTITVSLEGKDSLVFRMNPKVDGKEQYHIEYSRQSVFGKDYINWAIPVLTLKDFKELTSRLQQRLSLSSSAMFDIPIFEEKKSDYRERMFYAKVPFLSYKFSVGEFSYAKDYFDANGIQGILPSLVFKNEPKYLEKLNPLLKLGFIATSKEDGFEERKPQIALKVAQPKVTDSLRGVPGKAKGLIEELEPYENYFVVPAKLFTLSAIAINQKFGSK